MAAAGACHGPGSRLQYRSQLHAPEAHLLFHVKGGSPFVPVIPASPLNNFDHPAFYFSPFPSLSAVNNHRVIFSEDIK